MGSDGTSTSGKGSNERECIRVALDRVEKDLTDVAAAASQELSGARSCVHPTVSEAVTLDEIEKAAAKASSVRPSRV